MTEAEWQLWIDGLIPFVPALAAYFAWGWADAQGTFEVKVGPRLVSVPKGPLREGWWMALVLALVGVGMGIAGGATAAAMLSGALVVALASCLWRLNRAVLCPRCEGYRATPLELRAETGRGGEVKRYRITVDCPGCDFKASGRVRAGESSLGQLSSFVGRARVATGLATALIFWKVFAVGLGVFLVFLLFGGLLLALLIFSILARTTSSRRSYSNWSRSSSGGAWAPSSFKGSYSSGGWTSGSSSSLGGGSSGGGGAGRGF